MNNLNYDQKLNLLFSLLKLAEVDHEVSPGEVEFIYRIGQRIEIQERDIDELIKSNKTFNPPKHEMQRIVLFYTFLLLMKIDGHFTETEVGFCKSIGFKLGLNSNAVNLLINKLMDTENKKITSEEVIQLFKLYHN